MIENPYRELNLAPTRKQLLELGVFVLVVTLAIGAYQYRFHARPVLAKVLWEVGAAVFVLSFIPPVGRILYIGWMGLGLTLGVVTTPVIMLALYVSLFVPLGLIFKLIGRDAMRRKLDKNADTYWEPYPKTEQLDRYFRQY